MGEAIGQSHTTVGRIEDGLTRPKVQQVRLWLDKIAAADPSLVDAGLRHSLMDSVQAMHAEIRGWPELLGDEGHVQHEIARREQGATRVRNYQDEVVPGLLQTPEYARAYFERGRTTDIDAAVLARIGRQQILAEAGREFVFLIAERVLRQPFGGTQILAEQRDRIVSLAKRATVEVAILPDGAAPRVVWHNFTLWDTPDGPYAMSELEYGQPERADPADLERLEQLWNQLWAAAVHGEDALDLIRALQSGPDMG